MKKIILALFVLNFSNLVVALPADSEKLIQAMMTNPDYIKLINENPIQGVSISVAKNITVEIRRKCRELSRSASIVIVRLELKTPMVTAKTYYFSTPQDPADLTLCP